MSRGEWGENRRQARAIEYAVEMAGLTQRQFAASVHEATGAPITPDHVQHWIRGTGPEARPRGAAIVPAWALEAVAAFLGLTEAELRAKAKGLEVEPVSAQVEAFRRELAEARPVLERMQQFLAETNRGEGDQTLAIAGGG